MAAKSKRNATIGVISGVATILIIAIALSVTRTMQCYHASDQKERRNKCAVHYNRA